jgi:hypothetical protein
MHAGEKHFLSIWLFIGLLLIVYGSLIMGQGLWEMFNPAAHPVVLAELRASIWWGALMLVVGGVFVGKNARW